MFSQLGSCRRPILANFAGEAPTLLVLPFKHVVLHAVVLQRDKQRRARYYIERLNSERPKSKLCQISNGRAFGNRTASWQFEPNARVRLFYSYRIPTVLQFLC